ncbi:hypothetical protein GGX14DRAFT_666076, partial [Mycena pura]
MVIEDVNDPTPRKASPTPPTPPPLGTCEPGLPQLPPPYISYYQAITPPILEPRRKPSQRRLRRRTYLILASLALNFFLFFLLARSGRRAKEAARREDRVDDSEQPKRRIEAVVPGSQLGWQCVHNVTWSKSTTRLPNEAPFPFESTASFQFSDPASLMFLLSQGSHSEGHLNVLTSPDALPHAIVTAVRYHFLRVRDRANVCWMERKHASGAGVGIFTPAPFDGQTPDDILDFDITLFLPTGHVGSSLPIYNLETQSLIYSDSRLFTKNKPIIVKSLFAKNATIKSSNGYISGSFDASSYLRLETSNAPIDVTVNLHNQNVFATTELVLQTRNAQLESAVNLLTSSATGEGGKFIIQAETSDAPLSMTFPASPTRSILNLDAQTSNSPADVRVEHDLRRPPPLPRPEEAAFRILRRYAERGGD